MRTGGTAPRAWLQGGSIAALATPFTNGALDTQAFVRLCDRQVAAGTRALVVCGSTGEALALRAEEQATLLRLALAAADGRVPVIAGCGGASTEAAAAIAILAAKCGAAALLCAPTPYVKPSQQAIAAHMHWLANVSGLPLILYDVPGRTGVAIRDQTVADLFLQGVAIGIKDATADLSRPPRLRALCGDDLLQLSGDDATAAAHRAAGGHGCISVTANVAPALCGRMHQAWRSGDLTTFGRLRDKLSPLHDALFLESNPVPLKAALAVLRLASAEVRLPLLPAAETTRERIGAVLDDIMDDERGLLEQKHLVLSD